MTDSVGFVRLRLKEIIVAKLDRIKAIEIEREELLREIDEARTMLAIPHDASLDKDAFYPKPVIPTPPPNHHPKIQLSDVVALMEERGPLSIKEISDHFGVEDGRRIGGAMAAWARARHFWKDADGRYSVVNRTGQPTSGVIMP